MQETLSAKVNTTEALIVAGPGKAGIITDIISRTNEDLDIYHSAWSMSDTTLEYMESVSNEVYSIGFAAPIYMDQYNDFVDTVLSNQGWTKNVFTFTAYETMYFVDYVLAESKSLKVKDVKKVIYDIDVYKGKFYDFKFNNSGDGAKSFSLYKVEDNDYIVDLELID